MRNVDTIIIGGGQAGLALSYCLTRERVQHVILERGRVGERWRSERWASLRLLTPRWQARLPGWSYDGPDPDGFMTSAELVDYLEAYAASFGAPLHRGVDVTSVRRVGSHYHVETNEGPWHATHVVIATGDAQHAKVPAFATGLAAGIEQVVPTRYRRPAELRPGGVLVVGASATGLQLAAEIHASGRSVYLSVGRHTRLPRRYRGRDILAWLDEMGLLDQTIDQVHDLSASRGQPSLQLVGSAEARTLDLGTVQAAGVRLLGRACDADGHLVRFGDNLVEDAAAADLKLASLLRRIDAYADGRPEASLLPPRPDFSATAVEEGPSSLDLRREGIGTVVWATGYRRSYPWLNVPVLDEHGEIRHEGGITPSAGLYVMGLRFMRRRNSSFIDGQARDAEELSAHLVARRRAVAVA